MKIIVLALTKKLEINHIKNGHYASKQYLADPKIKSESILNSSPDSEFLPNTFI